MKFPRFVLKFEFGHHHEDTCKRKVQYGKESARLAAIAMEEKTGDKFDVYECVACGRWHIGHHVPPQER